MTEDLPTEYDAIVVGTGMTESIVAAALARNGLSVLHIDRNDHYSADWSTFNFQGLETWIKNYKENVSLTEPNKEKINSLLEEGEEAISMNVKDGTFINFENFVFCKLKSEKQQESDLTGKANAAVDEPATTVTDMKETEIEDRDTTVTETESDTENQENHKENQESYAENQDKPEVTEETNMQSPSQDTSIPCGECQQEIPEKLQQEKDEWTLERIKQKWRSFNIDLSPKVLYCSGDMVQLLISSDVAKYCEFKTVTRVLTLMEDEIAKVPCSRADVFESKQVSMIEKRMMMKFFQFCSDTEKHQEELNEYKDKPFSEFLTGQKLSAKIQHYIQDAIAMSSPETSTTEAMSSLQKFLKSLGRYGNTAFLWPMYGSGELPQCFCRMCAVFGGIYYLQKAPAKLIISKDKSYVGIIDTDGLKLKSKWLIMNTSYASESVLSGELGGKKSLSRAVLVTDRSLLKDNTEHISLMHLPASNINPQPIKLFELSHVSQACPKQLYVVHMTTQSTSTAKQDFTAIVEKLFCVNQCDGSTEQDDRPHVLWLLYYNCVDYSETKLNSKIDNVFLVRGAGNFVDCDHCVQEAKLVFDQLCSGDEFLPKAPNPEDIIYYDENGEQNVGEESQEESTDNQQETDPKHMEPEPEGDKKEETKSKDTVNDSNKNTDDTTNTDN